MRRALMLIAASTASCSGPRPTGPTLAEPRPTGPSASASAPRPQAHGTDAGNRNRKQPEPGTAGVSCAKAAPAALDSCRELARKVAHPASSCDAGFRPRHARYVYCEASDLVCAIRQPAWDHAPVYAAATDAQAPACLRECEAGNGASCARLARAFAKWGSGDAYRRCATHLEKEACRLGLPSACAEHPACPDEPSRRDAFAELVRACEPAVATWHCFYAAHSREMLWGTGPAADPRGPFRELCAARCPPSPKRCYLQMACAVVSLP